MVTMNVLDIPQGYKKTEVGVIPEDWEIAQLSNLCERISVGLATSVTKYYRNKGVPIVRNMNIKDGYFDSEDMLYLDSGFAKRNISKAARAFDVITVHTGSNIGLTCVLPENFDYCQTFTTLITTTNKKRLNPLYLSFHMGSESGKKEILRLQVGGGKGNLNTGELKQYLLSYPKKLTEQNAIATALSDIDTLISELEKLIAKKQAIRTATMQQLLTGKTRLPQFALRADGSRKGYKQSELGEIPEDWKVEGFGTLFEPFVLKKGIKQNENVSFIGMQDVTEQAQLFKQHLVTFNKIKSGFTYFERGDVLVAKITPCFENGKGCYTGQLQTEYGFGSTEFHVLRATNKSDPKFIYYWSTRDVFRRNLESEMVGSAGHRRVPLSAIANYKIAIPQEVEQTAIAKILSDMDSEIQALEKRLVKTRQIKQGMMQELLTGKTRLLQGTVNT